MKILMDYEKRNELYELYYSVWVQYHYKCEEYDKEICSDNIFTNDGYIIIIKHKELGLSRANAKKAMARLKKENNISSYFINHDKGLNKIWQEAKSEVSNFTYQRLKDEYFYLLNK